MPWRSKCVVALCLAVFAGCGSGGERSKTVEVSGTVIHAGEPVAGGTLFFKCESARMGKAEVGPDGTFTVGTYGTDDGAVAGRHTLEYVAPSTTNEGPEGGHEAGPRSPFAGLVPKEKTVVVEEDTGDLQIELVRP